MQSLPSHPSQAGMPVGPDRRLHRRTTSLKLVRVEFNDGKSGFDAFIRNVSAYGAEIETTLPEHIPADVTLNFLQDEFKVPSRVIWRQSGAIGVEFLPRG